MSSRGSALRQDDGTTKSSVTLSVSRQLGANSTGSAPRARRKESLSSIGESESDGADKPGNKRNTGMDKKEDDSRTISRRVPPDSRGKENTRNSKPDSSLEGKNEVEVDEKKGESSLMREHHTSAISHASTKGGARTAALRERSDGERRTGVDDQPEEKLFPAIKTKKFISESSHRVDDPEVGSSVTQTQTHNASRRKPRVTWQLDLPEREDAMSQDISSRGTGGIKDNLTMGNDKSEGDGGNVGKSILVSSSIPVSTLDTSYKTESKITRPSELKRASNVRLSAVVPEKVSSSIRPMGKPPLSEAKEGEHDFSEEAQHENRMEADRVPKLRDPSEETSSSTLDVTRDLGWGIRKEDTFVVTDWTNIAGDTTQEDELKRRKAMALAKANARHILKSWQSHNQHHYHQRHHDYQHPRHQHRHYHTPHRYLRASSPRHLYQNGRKGGIPTRPHLVNTGHEVTNNRGEKISFHWQEHNGDNKLSKVSPVNGPTAIGKLRQYRRRKTDLKRSPVAPSKSAPIGKDVHGDEEERPVQKVGTGASRSKTATGGAESVASGRVSASSNCQAKPCVTKEAFVNYEKNNQDREYPLNKNLNTKRDSEIPCEKESEHSSYSKEKRRESKDMAFMGEVPDMSITTDDPISSPKRDVLAETSPNIAVGILPEVSSTTTVTEHRLIKVPSGPDQQSNSKDLDREIPQDTEVKLPQNTPLALPFKVEPNFSPPNNFGAEGESSYSDIRPEMLVDFTVVDKNSLDKRQKNDRNSASHTPDKRMNLAQEKKRIVRIPPVHKAGDHPDSIPTNRDETIQEKLSNCNWSGVDESANERTRDIAGNQIKLQQYNDTRENDEMKATTLHREGDKHSEVNGSLGVVSDGDKITGVERNKTKPADRGESKTQRHGQSSGELDSIDLCKPNLIRKQSNNIQDETIQKVKNKQHLHCSDISQFKNNIVNGETNRKLSQLQAESEINELVSESGKSGIKTQNKRDHHQLQKKISNPSMHLRLVSQEPTAAKTSSVSSNIQTQNNLDVPTQIASESSVFVKKRNAVNKASPFPPTTEESKVPARELTQPRRDVGHGITDSSSRIDRHVSLQGDSSLRRVGRVGGGRGGGGREGGRDGVGRSVREGGGGGGRGGGAGGGEVRGRIISQQDSDAEGMLSQQDARFAMTTVNNKRNNNQHFRNRERNGGLLRSTDEDGLAKIPTRVKITANKTRPTVADKIKQSRPALESSSVVHQEEGKTSMKPTEKVPVIRVNGVSLTGNNLGAGRAAPLASLPTTARNAKKVTRMDDVSKTKKSSLAVDEGKETVGPALTSVNKSLGPGDDTQTDRRGETSTRGFDDSRPAMGSNDVTLNDEEQNPRTEINKSLFSSKVVNAKGEGLQCDSRKRNGDEAEKTRTLNHRRSISRPAIINDPIIAHGPEITTKTGNVRELVNDATIAPKIRFTGGGAESQSRIETRDTSQEKSLGVGTPQGNDATTFKLSLTASTSENTRLQVSEVTCPGNNAYNTQQGEERMHNLNELNDLAITNKQVNEEIHEKMKTVFENQNKNMDTMKMKSNQSAARLAKHVTDYVSEKPKPNAAQLSPAKPVNYTFAPQLTNAITSSNTALHKPAFFRPRTAGLSGKKFYDSEDLWSLNTEEDDCIEFIEGEQDFYKVFGYNEETTAILKATRVYPVVSFGLSISSESDGTSRGSQMGRALSRSSGEATEENSQRVKEVMHRRGSAGAANNRYAIRGTEIRKDSLIKEKKNNKKNQHRASLSDTDRSPDRPELKLPGSNVPRPSATGLWSPPTTSSDHYLLSLHYINDQQSSTLLPTGKLGTDTERLTTYMNTKAGSTTEITNPNTKTAKFKPKPPNATLGTVLLSDRNTSEADNTQKLRRRILSEADISSAKDDNSLVSHLAYVNDHKTRRGNTFEKVFDDKLSAGKTLLPATLTTHKQFGHKPTQDVSAQSQRPQHQQYKPPPPPPLPPPPPPRGPVHVRMCAEPLQPLYHSNNTALHYTLSNPTTTTSTPSTTTATTTTTTTASSTIAVRSQHQTFSSGHRKSKSEDNNDIMSKRVEVLGNSGHALTSTPSIAKDNNSALRGGGSACLRLSNQKTEAVTAHAPLGQNIMASKPRKLKPVLHHPGMQRPNHQFTSGFR